MDKYDILMVRACKAGDNVATKLRRIWKMRCLLPDSYNSDNTLDGYIALHLIELVVAENLNLGKLLGEICLKDEDYVAGYGYSGKHHSHRSLRFIISFLRFTEVSKFSNFITPAKFREVSKKSESKETANFCYIKVPLEESQKSNLIILHNHLKSLDSDLTLNNTSSYVYGVKAGIDRYNGESWVHYSWRAFIRAEKSKLHRNAWDWLFDYNWNKTDNTLLGVAKRIEILLYKGLPTNWENQIDGKVELEYKETEEEEKRKLENSSRYIPVSMKEINPDNLKKLANFLESKGWLNKFLSNGCYVYNEGLNFLIESSFSAYINHSSNSDAWSWCFDRRWERTDNTTTGAAKRIRILLEKGLPRNWKDQMDGDVDLEYSN